MPAWQARTYLTWSQAHKVASEVTVQQATEAHPISHMPQPITPLKARVSVPHLVASLAKSASTSLGVNP